MTSRRVGFPAQSRWSIPAKAIHSILFLFVLASRLPFCWTGFGADADAWATMVAARSMGEGGVYAASRLPGYPVVEIAYALLLALGEGAAMLASPVVGALAAVLFASILMRLGSGGWRAVVAAIAFAFTPVVFIAGTVTLDYIWALTFVLAAVWAALTGRLTVAGVLLGLAVGCRLTSVMMLPVVLLAGWRGDRDSGFHGAFRIAGMAALVSVVCYLPPMLRYGPGFLGFYDAFRRSPAEALENYLEGVWGIWGIAGLLVGSALAGIQALTKRGLRPTDACSGVALLWTFVVYTLLYVRLPLESGYLLPVVPFAIGWMALRFPTPAFAVVCLGLTLSPFLDVEFGKGPLLREESERRAEMSYVQSLGPAIMELPRGSVLLTGAYTPMVGYLFPDSAVTLLPSISGPQMDHIVRRGGTVHTLRGAGDLSEATGGVNPEKLGGRRLVGRMAQLPP